MFLFKPRQYKCLMANDLTLFNVSRFLYFAIFKIKTFIYIHLYFYQVDDHCRQLYRPLNMGREIISQTHKLQFVYTIQKMCRPNKIYPYCSRKFRAILLIYHIFCCCKINKCTEFIISWGFIGRNSRSPI